MAVKTNRIPVVVITGGNNGLGYHMSVNLLKEKYRVSVFDLSGENMSALQSSYPDQLLYCKCNVTNDAEIKSSVEEVIRKWGRIDILVNNAALAIFKSFEEKTLEQTKNEFDVNYFGYVRMINAVIPHMKEQGEGIIYNVSSGIGITGFENIYGYASTKAAIESLTRTLSIELEKYNISVNLMHPPLMHTKSAAPLGIPPQMMEDPAIIGSKLAKKILSNKAVVTPDFRTSLFLFLCKIFPNPIGKFLSKMTRKAKEQESKQNREE